MARQCVTGKGLTVRTLLKAPTKNLLLAALPGRDRRQLLERCEPVELILSEVLYNPGERIRHVYFPTGSFVSLIISTEGHERLEVGMVGDEGMVGTSVVLGVDIAHVLALVQGAGPAWRMNVKDFRRQLGESAALKRLLDRYIYVELCQLTQTAACTRFHLLEARLARWLLMIRDRAHSNEFHVTHEFLSYILGVRRAGVTRAAISLQAQELIRYSRGDLSILDEAGLEGAACGCYAADRKSYASVLD